MIILDEKQGSPEWKAARSIIPTTSEFSRIITSKGEPSKSTEKLICELIEGKNPETRKKNFSSGRMDDGTEREPEARAFFSLYTGLKVEEVGLCYYDERRDRGASPDGLIVGKKEGLEIKCPSLFVHKEYLEKGELPTAHFHQVQGSLYITGYDRWHFLSYFPGLKPFHIIVERDEIWIAKLSKLLDEFNVELNDTHEALKGA